MIKKNAGPKKSATTTRTAKVKLTEAAASTLLDPEDKHLFVPHIEKLELTAAGLESDRELYTAMLESICGVVDDSQPVEQYDGSLGVPVAFVNAHQSAACQVQWNNNLASVYTNPGNVSDVRWGSATMISNDLMLTCGHLFDQTGGGWQRPRINGTTNIISPQEIARNMHVNFNFQVDASGNLRTEQSFAILELIEYRLGGLDMALCRVGGTPGATFGRTTVSTTDAASPDLICIIGHPAGQPKRIEAGPTTRIEGNLIHYNDIDTLGGNSGSGILRASDGRLVGIHTNGGCTSASPGDSGTNFGQRIAAVIAISPTLQALTRPKLKFRDDVGGGTLKFRDDGGGGKLKFVDDGTFKFRDDVATLKFRDDVKLPVLDKRPDFENKNPIADGKGGLDIPDDFDPVRIRTERPAVRPFILSTPHHSSAWQSMSGYSNSAHEEIETILVQYEQAIAKASAELQQLENDYREVYAQYESMVNGGQHP